MTVSTTINRNGPYAGNGSTTTFGRTFRVDDAADLKVFQTVSGATTEVTSGVTKTDIGSDTGNVVFDVAPASGVLITLIRSTERTQATDYAAQGRVSPTQVEQDIDLLVMQVQDLSERLDRAPLLEVQSSTKGLSIGEPDAGKLVKWNAGGTGFDAGPTYEQINADKVSAVAAAAAAAVSQDAAAASETAASASQVSAANSATGAGSSEAAAALSASNASASEVASSLSASSAATSATSAASSASSASASETAAASSATAASNSEAAASVSQSAAATSASNAAASEVAASTSATNAASSASTASSAASSASTSASAASASETNAASSASSAATSATQASTSASQAAASETAAGASEVSAAGSASSASSSATSAASSASSAQTAADTALAALDSFDDRYLGQKAADPTLDNDGNPLVAGALYFNTTDGAMKVYDGASWVAAYASLSGALIVTNNLSDVADAPSARTNLGLGSAATTDSIDYAAAVHSHIDATTSVAGFMSTIDKTKLDGIEAGATADQTAAEILTAIKTVDGAGSGLDADLLDGQSGAYYQPAATAITTSNIGSQSVSYAASAGDADTLDGNHATAFATAAQGALADSAVQPTDTQLQATWEAGTGTTESLVSPAKMAAAIAALGGGGLTVDVQEFTTSGTWTKPADATIVVVELFGAGGGGGSGRVWSASNNIPGGGGGGGGGSSYVTFAASDLSATEAVIIGAGGNGAAAVSSIYTYGNSGSDGGSSSFGGVVYATGGRGGGGATNSGLGGAGGFGISHTFNVRTDTGAYGGGSSYSSGGNHRLSVEGSISPCGGGGGGAISSANVELAAGLGGSRSITIANILDVYADGAGSGVSGSDGASHGYGGGGGGPSVTSDAGSGGDGAAGGGGGGGGGSALNGYSSGAGGNGGAGWCRVTTYA